MRKGASPSKTPRFWKAGSWSACCTSSHAALSTPRVNFERDGHPDLATISSTVLAFSLSIFLGAAAASARVAPPGPGKQAASLTRVRASWSSSTRLSRVWETQSTVLRSHRSAKASSNARESSEAKSDAAARSDGLGSALEMTTAARVATVVAARWKSPHQGSVSVGGR